MKAVLAITFALLSLTFTGCGEGPCSGLDCGLDHEHAAQAPHAHPTIGPHQGQLIELGAEEYHAELVLDEATESTTIYLLDSAALDAVATDATEAKINLVHDDAAEQFLLAASPQIFDAAGYTSRFVSADKEIHEELEHSHGSTQLVVAIKGKQYHGKIEGEHHHEASEEPHLVK